MMSVPRSVGAGGAGRCRPRSYSALEEIETVRSDSRHISLHYERVMCLERMCAA